MPIVFVHGVNNREGDGYGENKLARDAFLKRLVGPVLVPSAGDEVAILNPYWGGDGVTFAWDMAVLPDPGMTLESFGGDEDRLQKERTANAAATILPAGTAKDEDLLAVARRDLSVAVELLFAAEMAGVSSEAEAKELAAAYEKAAAYAVANPKPDWLSDPRTSASSFPAYLGKAVNQKQGESFGGTGWGDKLKEGFGRLTQAIPDAVNGLAQGRPRKALNDKVTRFAGDAFVYLVERTRQGKDAPIVKVVMDALREADGIRSKPGASDDKLIVMAHSFGGEIVYDILTKFWPDLEVDCLVTIGSQVGLFEEMKLYEASDRAIPGRDDKKRALAGKVAPQWKVKRWLNVFDLNDVLSYRTEPVFQGSEDFKYDTGYSTLQAHGGYFERPSFYGRLSERLKDAVKGG